LDTNNHHGDAAKSAGARRRNWKRIHHSWLFWVGVVLFLAAAAIYVLSDDLSWQPKVR
jgi:hypothetical protein